MSWLDGFGTMYFNCELCGKYTDEGALIPYDKNGKKFVHICFDCSDRQSHEETIRLYEEKYSNDI